MNIAVVIVKVISVQINDLWYMMVYLSYILLKFIKHTKNAIMLINTKNIDKPNILQSSLS